MGKGKEASKAPRWVRYLLVLLVLIILIGALASTVREPEVDVTGLNIKASSHTSMRTSFIVKVDNPNIVGVRVLTIDGKAYVNGKYTGDFQRAIPVDIPAMATTSFEVDFKLQNVVPVKYNANNDVRVVGIATIDGALSDWAVPFDETRTVHVP